MESQLTDEAREVLRLAEDEARRMNHEYIGTEHLLLGLMKDSAGVVARALQSFDVHLQKVRTEVENMVGIGPELAKLFNLPYSPRAKNVFQYAIDTSQRLGQKLAGPEHLLIGLLHEREGVAAQVLKTLGVRDDRLLPKMLDLLSPDRHSNTLIEAELEDFDPTANIEELPSDDSNEWTLEQCFVPLVRMACEDGFSMEQTTKLAQRWHREYVAKYRHSWSPDWDEQIAVSLLGENGPALQPETNEIWYPWWERLIRQLGTDGVFRNPDRPETWQILK